jgi:hypothetical protein
MNTPKKTVYLPKTAYSGYTYTEWEKEYELPETMAGISKLIQIESLPEITDVTTKSNIADVFGKNTFRILYQSAEDGSVEPLNFSDDFDVSIDMKTDSDNLLTFARVFCTFISCKVISPRKLYIKGKNKIHLEANENVATEIPDINSGNNILFYDTVNFPFQELLPPLTQSFSFEEEFTVDSSYPSVDKIIFSSVRLIPLDIVKSFGSLTLNTSAIFKAFYEGDGKYNLFSRSVPLALTIENETIDENTIIYYYLAVNDQMAEKDIDKYGEDRVLRFFYSPSLTVFRVKEKNEELPKDVFSPSDLLSTKTENLNFNELVDVFSRPFTIEKIFEIPGTEISEIYDTNAVMDVESIEKTEQGEKINGICGISVLGKTESGIDSVSFTVNFSEMFPEMSGSAFCRCSVIPTGASAMITGRDVITVRVSANATIRRYEARSQEVISDFSTSSARETRDKSCITIYYPNEKETLWDISKEYGIDPVIMGKENASSFTADGIVAKGVKSVLIP